MPAASYWRPVTISHTVPRAECYRSSFMCWQKYSTCQQCASVAVECEMSIDQQQAWVQHAVFLHAMVTRWERKQHLFYDVGLSAVSSAQDLGSSHVGFVNQFRCHTREFRCGWNCPRFCVAYLLGRQEHRVDAWWCVFTSVIWEICWVGFQLHLGLRVFAENSSLLCMSVMWHLYEDGMLWSAVRTKVIT